MCAYKGKRMMRADLRENPARFYSKQSYLAKRRIILRQIMATGTPNPTKDYE